MQKVGALWRDHFHGYREIIEKLSAIFFLCITILPITAGAISDNVILFNTCNKSKKGAESGSHDTQFAYGLLFSIGKCAFLNIKQPATVVQWWSKTAALGQPDAQFALGVSFLKGTDVSKNRYKAYQLINQAAFSGSNEAQNFLNLCKEDPANTACY